MPYVLALDQGTTSSRAILFDRSGTALAVAQREFGQRFPREGWVEHDAEEIWQSQRDVARRVLGDAGVDPGEVCAVGITNQRETTVVWDRATGRPVAPAIVWQDRRTASACDTLRSAGHEVEIRRRTGLVLDPYFSATKIAWILEHVEGSAERARRGELAFGTIDSWLVWNLTGGRRHVTDASNASRTMLYGLESGDWDDRLLELFDVPRGLLPEIVPSCGVCGRTDPEVLGAAVPIAGIAGDQQAALFGQQCTGPGTMKNTYGTGCFMLLNTGSDVVRSEHGLLTTVAWQIDGARTYALEGSIFVAGAAVQWLRDGLGLVDRTDEVEVLARSVPDTGDVYFVPAFTGLGAPYWDPYARGTVLGLTRGTTAGHVARAALESMAFQTVDVIRAMERDADLHLVELRVDGGASLNDLLMQVQADLAGIDVIRARTSETTALGAALLAGLAVGFWKDERELSTLARTDRRFSPSVRPSEAERRIGQWHRAVERSRMWTKTSDAAPRAD